MEINWYALVILSLGALASSAFGGVLSGIIELRVTGRIRNEDEFKSRRLRSHKIAFWLGTFGIFLTGYLSGAVTQSNLMWTSIALSIGTGSAVYLLTHSVLYSYLLRR